MALLNKKKISNAQDLIQSIKHDPDYRGIYPDIPAVLTDEKGTVYWFNSAFEELTLHPKAGMHINKLIPQLSDKKIEISGSEYKKESSKLTYENKEYTLFRFIDNFKHLSKIGEHMGVVCLIRIDNLEELQRNLKMQEHTEVLSKVYLELNNFATDNHGLIEQYDRDKFIIVFEKKMLKGLMSDKFSIINRVHDIKNSAEEPISLSVAVGSGKSLRESQEFARSTLELCSARGGDQAIVKQGEKHFFYGGTSRNVDRKSQVKMRQISRNLKNLMEQSSEVFVMGHEVPDLDSFSASVGVVSLARHLNKKGYIVLNKPNLNISPLINLLKNAKHTPEIIGTEEALLLMKPTSMLCVVDTQIEKNTECPELIHKTQTLVVIDHHLRGTSHLSSAKLTCHEPYASSTCELIAEIMLYFDDKVFISPLEAEALLSGIVIDTKGFSFNTGIRTFDAASYLRRCGADTMSIRSLYQDDLKTFVARAEIVKQSKILSEGIAVSKVEKGTPNAMLLAAQAADSLLTISGISASFVVAELADSVTISGRSLGSLNVQLILEKLGGGGHSTIAGAKIKNSNGDEVIDMLVKTIEEYMKHNKEVKK